MSDKSEDLRAAIQSLGWSQQRLADWLSEQTGNKIPLGRVQAWLADPDASYARTCPGWPLALLTLSGEVNT